MTKETDRAPMSEIKLPEPVFEAAIGVGDPGPYKTQQLFTADQMRAAILEERERCARIVEKMAIPYENNAADTADAIRNQ